MSMLSDRAASTASALVRDLVFSIDVALSFALFAHVDGEISDWATCDADVAGMLGGERRAAVRECMTRSLEVHQTTGVVVDASGTHAASGHHLILDRMFADALEDWSPETAVISDLHAAPVPSHDLVIVLILDPEELARRFDGRIPRFLRTMLKSALDLVCERLGSTGGFVPVTLADVTTRAGAEELTVALESERVLAAEFQLVGDLAMMRLEKADSQGILAFAGHHCPVCAPAVTLRRPIEFRDDLRGGNGNVRTLRKLLEMSVERTVVPIVEGGFVRGLARPEDLDIERIVLVEFRGAGDWRLFKLTEPVRATTRKAEWRTETLMYVEGPLARPPLDVYRSRNFANNLLRVFGEPVRPHVDVLRRAARQVLGLHQGTMLVIAQDAVREVERLSDTGFPLAEPIELALLGSLTRIDGAVVLDLAGRIHGIGMILDGLSGRSGEPSRGARYNSAVRFVESRMDGGDGRCPVAIFVVSDDGIVDFVPMLPEKIPAPIYHVRMSAVRSYADGLVDELPQKELLWLERHPMHVSLADAAVIERAIARTPGAPSHFIRNYKRPTGNPFARPELVFG